MHIYVAVCSYAASKCLCICDSFIQFLYCICIEAAYQETNINTGHSQISKLQLARMHFQLFLLLILLESNRSEYSLREKSCHYKWKHCIEDVVFLTIYLCSALFEPLYIIIVIVESNRYLFVYCSG